MGDGRLGAQSDFVNCARDPVPVITRDPEYAQIADGYEDGGQRQAQNRISCPVKRRRPRIVAEIWRAAAQPDCICSDNNVQRLNSSLSLCHAVLLLLRRRVK